MQSAFDAIPCVTPGYMLSARLVNQKRSLEKCGGRLRGRKPVMKGGVENLSAGLHTALPLTPGTSNILTGK